MFGLVLEALAFALLWSTVNLLSATLAVSAMLFYVFVYTIWLKPRSPQNIVIGGAAGAVPVLVGLGRGHRRARGAGVGAVRHRVLLDAAALLGAVAEVLRRLQGRGHPDAAGGEGHPGRGPPDRGVLVRRGRDHLHAPAHHRQRRRGLPGDRGGARGPVHRPGDPAGARHHARPRPYGCSRSRTPTSRSSSPPLPSTPSSAPSEPPPPRAGPRWLLAVVRGRRWWSWWARSPGSRWRAATTTGRRRWSSRRDCATVARRPATSLPTSR